MDTKLHKQVLINLYHSYASVLHKKGVPFVELTNEELEAMDDFQIADAAMEVRDLARTPTSR